MSTKTVGEYSGVPAAPAGASQQIDAGARLLTQLAGFSAPPPGLAEPGWGAGYWYAFDGAIALRLAAGGRPAGAPEVPARLLALPWQDLPAAGWVEPPVQARPRLLACRRCAGSGVTDEVNCPVCAGQGRTLRSVRVELPELGLALASLTLWRLQQLPGLSLARLESAGAPLVAVRFVGGEGLVRPLPGRAGRTPRLGRK